MKIEKNIKKNVQKFSPVCVKIKKSSFCEEKQIFYQKFSKKSQISVGITADLYKQPKNNRSISNFSIDYLNASKNSHKTSVIRISNNNFRFEVKPLIEKIVYSNSLNAQKKPRTENSSPKLKKNPKIVTKVGYKEALKYQDWVMIAKPEIEQKWKNIINESNGLKPAVFNNISYKFFIGKGNNSALIKKLVLLRPWWVVTDNALEANFIWTQWIEKNIIYELPLGTAIIHSVDKNNLLSLKCQVPVKMNEVYRQVDLHDLGFFKIRNSTSYTALNIREILPIQQKLYNKLEFNECLTNKKGLFKSLKKYYDKIGLDIFKVHPVTFHIKTLEKNSNFSQFLKNFTKFEKKKKTVWIIKPGENTNRGTGIHLFNSITEIKHFLKTNVENSQTSKSFIIQKYIERPFLINNRKFDIRCFSLITSINGIVQGYFYTDGYIRTSSFEYSLKDINNNFIHLTNDAIQKHSENYGQYEDNNKMSYKEFQRYLDHFFEKKISFFFSILPQIKNIVKETIQAVFLKIDSNKRLNCMEILGYDFMLDKDLKPWIIEVNTNPCLELSSSYLGYLIPAMVDNVFRITLDCLFPGTCNAKNSFDPVHENRFDLIFHELVDGQKVKERIKACSVDSKAV